MFDRYLFVMRHFQDQRDGIQNHEIDENIEILVHEQHALPKTVEVYEMVLSLAADENLTAEYHFCFPRDPDDDVEE